MSNLLLGSNSIVLHGHLPYVHEPSHEEFLEEDWLLEAIADTYLPLLAMLNGLAEDEIPVRLTIGLTPPLLEMFASPSLALKAEARLLRLRTLAEEEVRRLRNDAPRQKTAAHFLKSMAERVELWRELKGDLGQGFRRHQDEGRLEILASAATHAVLPLVATEELRRAQIRIGVDLYREVFGCAPKGFWLPECAFTPGLDRLLAEAGILYVILETHALTGATPAPKNGVFRPLRMPQGVFGFGRDLSSSRQVWAQEVGYPGDPLYRELYRDVAFDAPYDYIKRWLHKDGVRRNIGLKYHRVTGKVELHEKELYDPEIAWARADVHAGNFLWHRGEQARHLAVELETVPSILSPYDMELFGHWWFEGPQFLESIFRRMGNPETRAPVRILCPSDVLREGQGFEVGIPPLSTWGEGGFLKVWLNEQNAWVLRHQQESERRMLERANEHPEALPQKKRLLDQMLREVLLLQSSDWAFIMTKNTSVYYARKRVTDHVDRFLKLHDALEGVTPVDEAWLQEIERTDAIFPGLDYRVLLGRPSTATGRELRTCRKAVST